MRHEVKHHISPGDCVLLRPRLQALLAPDKYAINGAYLVNSIYFDTLEDKDLAEKIAGVSKRSKWRIRYYNNDFETLTLEKKIKRNQLGAKERAPLSKEAFLALVDPASRNGCVGSANTSVAHSELVQELMVRIKTEGYAPKSLLTYRREAYVYAPGNVRVTLDTHLRAACITGPMLKNLVQTGAHPHLVPVSDIYGVLEVKWDAYLPDIVRRAVQLDTLRTQANSKYAQARCLWM